MQYLITAFKKFIFCFKISADFLSFIKLLWFTKKYKWNRNDNAFYKAVGYNILLNKKKYTIHLRTYSGDIDIFYEIFFRKVYEIQSTKNASMVIDLGANVGLATLFFLSKYPSAKILSVEPDPENAKLFRKNLSKEITQGKVAFFEAAVSDHAGKMFLSQPVLKYNPTLSKEKSANAIEVEVLSMHQLVELARVDRIGILKIDIEGAEEGILLNNEDWLSKVDSIIVEIHSEKSIKNIVATLQQHHFSLRPSSANNSIHYFLRQ